MRIAAQQVSVVDTTGAGDCFVGALTTKISQNASIVDAITFANRAASVCVTRPGA